MWRRWNEQAEDYLKYKEGLEGRKYSGRGVVGREVSNTVSATQERGGGCALGVESKAKRDRIARIRELERLSSFDKPTTGQIKRMRNLREKVGVYTRGELEDLQKSYDLDVGELRKRRACAWREWNDGQWSSGGRAIYRWVRNRSDGVKIRLRGGTAAVKDRFKIAAEAWGDLWKPDKVSVGELPDGKLDPITWEEIEAVVNHLSDGKAKGTDSWSPAELRSPSKSHLRVLSDILNNIETQRRWPKGMGPVVALIPKDGVESEGQLRPIAILPYVYRVWMAVRKRRVKEWVLNLHGGGFRSPEDLVWEVAARAETAKANGRCHAAAYFDCSKCYERVRHDVAMQDALDTGCDPVIVALCFEMYGQDRTISVHGAEIRGIGADRGLLAGCGYAVHYLKATVNRRIKGENDVRDYVDDVVIQEEAETPEVLG